MLVHTRLPAVSELGVWWMLTWGRLLVRLGMSLCKLKCRRRLTSGMLEIWRRLSLSELKVWQRISLSEFEVQLGVSLSEVAGQQRV